MSLALAGCASTATTWDEITSRNLQVKNLFMKPDPMTTLRDSSDGAKRGRALAALKEPLENGGKQEDQEAYIKILTVAATEDREPLCRLGAIRALGDYKDPRAAKVLEDVYLQNLRFTPELNSVIRQQALASLEKNGNPEARHLLIRVARQPGGAADSSIVDRQQTLDERLAATRALGKYKYADCTEALLHILETEKDVAMRERAQESLTAITGKKLPADATAWREFLNHTPHTAPKQPGFFDRLLAKDAGTRATISAKEPSEK